MIILYILQNTEQPRSRKLLPALICVLLSFLIINTVKIQQLAAEQFAVNTADRVEAAQVMREIYLYETETGEKVETIAYRHDMDISRTYPGIANTYLDFGRRAATASWAVVSRINFYSGRDFEAVEMTDEEYSLHFPQENWYAFSPEEQIVFEGNVMYWALY